MTPLFKKKETQLSCTKEENVSKVKLPKNQHACVSHSTDTTH